MTQPDAPISLELDPTGYIAGINQASQATDQFGGSLRSSGAALAAVPLLMRKASSHLPMAGFVALSGVAAKTQQQLAPLRATTKVLGSDFEGMNKGIQRLAREMPIGTKGAAEMVTTLTKLGVTSKGQERNITDLAKVYTKLGGATGEGPIALAAGMTQLARVTNTGFQAKRIESLADSLTTVSAKSGASATGILEFSKLIAPLASASGVGTTKIMGISAAFSKLGDDGALGANAFNKMMGDLNKSVRDGSPMLANYASIVGKTQSQFLALAKSDPTEAITQVTEAISKAGSSGPRLLEQLGLEGPRTQRVLQQLSASGGLRQSVQDATGAYGDGSTDKGGQEAYKGLFDSMERFGTALEQVTESLGGPFLGMLTRTVNAAGFGVGGVRRVADSAVVQKGLTAFATVALPALMALRFLGGGVRATFAGQMATSGPVRGLAGGFAQGRAAVTGQAASETFAARRLGGGAYLASAAQGEYGRGRMIGVNQAAERLGARLGSTFAGAPTGGAGMFTMLRGAGVAATAAYMRMNQQSAVAARTPFAQREFQGTPQGQAFANYRTNSDYNRYLREEGQLTRRGYAANQIANVRALSTQVGQEGAFANARTLAGGFGRMAADTAVTGGAAAARAGGALVRGLGGPVGLGLTGLMVGMQVKGASNATEKKREAEAANATTFIDDYRVAMGKATDAVNTFAGAMSEATKNAGQRDDLSLDEIQSLAAKGGEKSRVQDFRGMTVTQAANKVNLARQSGGVGKEEIQRIKMDLFNSGFSADQVQQFDMQLTNGAGDLSGDTSLMTRQVAEADAGRKGHGLRRYAGGAQHFFVEGMGNMGFGNTNRHTIDTLTDRQSKNAADLVAEIGTRFGKRTTEYNVGFARQEQFRDIDEAVRGAISAGNVDYAERLEKDFSRSIGLESKSLTTRQLNAGGGSYTAALSLINKDFREGMFAEAQKGGSPDRSAGWTYKTLSDAHNPLATYFDQRGQSPAQQAVQAMVGPSGRPEDPQTQLNATEQVMAAASKGGMGIEALAVAAGHAANSLGDVSDANAAFIRQLRQAAALRLADQQSQMTTAGATRSRLNLAVETATQAPLGTEGLKERQTQQQVMQQEKSALIDRAQQRVATQREMQIQEERANDDFKKQMLYAEQDYGRQLDRTVEQYETTVFRTREQYEIQRRYSIEDFNRQRLYAQKDFDKQMARAAEDGAKAMYAPYQRIAVQATWDAANLLGNMREQNRAIAMQLDNLQTLRSSGGSSNLIKLLGLNDPANAQELASLVGDIKQDPTVLRALNASADERYRAGGQLVRDVDNVALTRQTDDFKQNMTRQDQVFEQSLQRSRDGLALTLRNMAADESRTLLHMAEDRDRMIDRAVEGNKKMLQRLHADAKRADTEITRDLGKLTRDLKDIMSGQTLSFKDDVANTLEGTVALINDFGKSGKFQKALEGLAEAGISLQLQTFDPVAQALGKPNTGNHPVDPLTGKPIEGFHAAGGIATRPHVGMIAEAGSPEGLIPLDGRGASFFSDVMRRLIGVDDLRQMSAAAGVGRSTYVSATTNIDHSQTFEQVTVVSQDPDEMAARLAARQRRSNLTAPAQAR